MMIDVGKMLMHYSVGNPDMIATDVELLGENWRAYQSLGYGIQASLPFWEFYELRRMHKPMEIQWDFTGMMRSIKEKDERVVEGGMVAKETFEHTPIDEASSIDEVFRVVTKFSGDNNAPQVDEVPEDSSTIVEDPIGTQVSRSMTKLPDDSHR